MPRNVEIKARLNAIDDVTPLIRPLATAGPTPIDQDDTFFTCPTGRLKLRMFDADRGELIFYQRSDDSGPSESSYVRAATSDPNALRECLRRAYGESGRVIKHRTLYLVGRTRVHLDRVEGLGDFMEIEVVLADDEPLEAGTAEAHTLMEQLHITPAQLIDCAYVDLFQSG